MLRHALRDHQSNRISCPARVGHIGGTASDNRVFVDAVIFRYREARR
jgi:hypothetical protein